MHELTRRVEGNVSERGLFRAGQRVLVAVSGGVDSMVLLGVLHSLARAHRWKLTVAHFNHLLRGSQADADEGLARSTARKLKLPFVAGRGDVRSVARAEGISLEMAARKLRHEFLAATAVKLKISTVVLAHHADDQVELFFLRLLRGAGGEGLGGMKWSNPSPVDGRVQLARPLLDVLKEELRAFAALNKIAFAEDDSNASLDMQRNRVRHELIPLLTRHYQPALARTVLRLMEVTGAEGEFVAEAAREWVDEFKKLGGHSGTPLLAQSAQYPKAPHAVLRVRSLPSLEGRELKKEFSRLPVAVQRRVIREQLMGLKIVPDFELIERLRLGGGQRITVGANCSIFLDAAGLIHRHEVEGLEFDSERREVALSGPSAKREVTFGELRICWEIADDSAMAIACKGEAIEYFDADKVGAPVVLRRWQPGDRFQPIGTRSARKLQDLFTNLKVPRHERRRRVVAATQAGEVFWVEGLRMAEKFKLDDNTARKLKWGWRRI